MDMAIEGQDSIAFQQKLYDDANPTRRGLHRARRAWIEQRLQPLLDRAKCVMEVGVGCGTFTRFISNHDLDIKAVDINPAFLAGVATLRQVTVIEGDATTDLGIRDIDVILCSEVIEHVPADRSQAMLKQFYASLAPGGTLILTTPQRFATVELMARLFKFPPVLWLARKIYGTAEELGHINLMTRGELGRQIVRAGFTVEERDLFGFYLPVVAEFGGTAGAGLLAAMGRLFKRMPLLSHLIWTQAWVLKKA